MIIHLCDNLEAVNCYNTPRHQHTMNFETHDMDIHMAIAANQSNIPHHEALWIKGHQDNGDGPISGNAQLNIDVNSFANDFMTANPAFLPPPLTVSLYYNHMPIT